MGLVTVSMGGPVASKEASIQGDLPPMSTVIRLPSPSSSFRSDNLVAMLPVENERSVAYASNTATDVAELGYTKEALAEGRLKAVDPEIGMSPDTRANIVSEAVNGPSSGLRERLNSAADWIFGLAKRARFAVESWSERLLGKWQWTHGCPV